MPVTIQTDPPAVVYDLSDLYPNPTSFSKSYAGGSAAEAYHQRQQLHSWRVSYAVRNGGPTNIVSGDWSVADAIIAGGFSFPGWVDAEVEANYDTNGVRLDPSLNLFDAPTATYASTVSSQTMSGSSHGFLSSHSFSFTENKIATVTATIRPDILAGLITNYPSGTITFLVQGSTSSTYDWDIHSGFIITEILSTATAVFPETTFPLTDFGVAPTDGWTLGDVSGGTWTRRCVSGGTWARACVSGGTWTRGDVTSG